MKLLFASAMLSLYLAGYSQSTTLIISRFHCKTNKSAAVKGADTVFIHRMPADTVAYTVIFAASQTKAELKAPSLGDYTLVYRNTSRKQVTKSITIQPVRFNKEDICVDAPASKVQYVSHSASTTAYPQYLDIAVDRQGTAFVIARTSANRYALLQNVQGTWKEVPGASENVLLKIQGRSKGVVVMSESGSIWDAKISRKLSVWDGATWKDIPVQELQGIVKDFGVSNRDKVWLAGMFRDEGRGSTYHLAIWDKDKLSLQGPPLTGEPKLQPLFNNGINAMMVQGDLVYLQLYNKEISNNTLLVVTGADDKWRLTGNTAFPLKQELSVIAVGDLNGPYIVLNCNTGTNSCVYEWGSGAWKLLTTNNAFVNEEIRALATDDRFNLMAAGKTKNKDGAHVILKWNGSTWEQYGAPLSAEVQDMAWHNGKIYAITGTNGNKVEVVSAFDTNWGRVTTIDVGTAPVTTGTGKPKPGTKKDVKAAEMLAAATAYVKEESEYLDKLNFWTSELNGQRVGYETKKAAMQVSTTIGYINSMCNRHRLAFDRLEVPYGGNRLKDVMTGRIYRLEIYLARLNEAMHAVADDNEAEFKRKKAAAGKAWDDLSEFISNSKSTVMQYAADNGL